MQQILEFFQKLTDSSDWPARWHCGQWTAFHGWLYICSDLMIWSAYFTIPVVILKYIRKKQGIRFIRLYFMFAAFILACGTTHFLDAAFFWVPLYRLNALMLFATGVISWITVFYLVKFLPEAFSLKSQMELEKEITQRKEAEEQVSKLNMELNRLVKERSAEVMDYKYALDQSSIIVVTDRKGIIGHVNDNFCTVSQYSREELLGEDLRRINEEYHSKEFIQNLWNTISAGGIWKGELKNRKKDGSPYWVDSTVVPFLNAEGNPRQFISIRTDITERKNAEEKQALLASIVLSSDDAIISIDRDEIITSWNLGASRLFGYGGQETLGENISMLIKPDLIDSETEIFRRIAKGEQIKHYETEGLGKNGKIIPISINASVIKDAGGEIIGSSQIIRNISERKHAQKIRSKLEQEIRAKHAEITDIFDRIADGFMVLDKNYRFSYMNYKIGEIVERDPLSLIGKYIWEEFPAIVDSPIHLAFLKAMAEQEFQICLYYFAPLDLWLENHIYPGPEGLSVFVRDMSRQKKAEIKIVQSEKIYQTIASSIPGSVICLLDPEYRYQLIEGDMIAKLGYKKDDLLNQRIEDVLRPERLAIELPEFKRVFRGETLSTESSQMGYDLITRYVPLKNENDQVYLAMMVSIDVTELKNAQRSITEMNVNLEQNVLERTKELAIVNRELEAFSYSVSHDLRAPLRAIIGFTTILEEEYCDPLEPEGKRIMAIIKNSTLKMGVLIDSLLAFSRLGGQAIAKMDVDVQRMVNDILAEQFLQNSASAITWDIGLLPRAFADVSTLKQVWINLISNAKKYSRKKEHPKITIGSFTNQNQIIFYVKDNGVGFDSAYRDKLFGVFQRLHGTSEFEGTGIGLALVSKIISKHGGKVWAEGEVNKGACFYFSLPQN
jgi:PAS domain S-box-containing protein